MASATVPRIRVTESSPGEPQLEGRWLSLEALADDRVLARLAVRLYADRSADAIPPWLLDVSQAPLYRILLERLGEELGHRGVRLITMYAPIESTVLQSELQAVRFHRGHDLLVLASGVGSRSCEDQSGDWRMVPYQQYPEKDFQRIFLETLIDALDFAELRVAASAEATLARFAESGATGTEMWYLVEYRGRLAGCLLMTGLADHQRCEVSYMGLAPRFRGIGGGHILAGWALSLAERWGRRLVVAGVDSQNDPAIAVYAAAGFDLWARRRVFFRQLSEGGDVTPC